MNKTLLWLTSLVCAFSSVAEAQQPGKISRIGYMTVGDSMKDPRFVAFRQGLRDIGYLEGKNVVIEFRSAEAKLERIPDLVTEFVQLKLDVLVITAQPAVRAAKEATKTIPIVMVGSFDPVATGIVDSLAHPGGAVGHNIKPKRDWTVYEERRELISKTRS